MDKVWMALLTTAPIVAFLGWAAWWLVTGSLRDRRQTRAATQASRRSGAVGRHHGRSVTVVELQEQAIQHGQAIRLNWSDHDLDEVGRVRPDAQDHCPTAVLPTLGDVGNDPVAR